MVGGAMWHDEPLTARNLSEVIDFVHRANPFAQHTWGWDSGRFMDWRWGSNALREAASPGWFSANCRVFGEGGRIRAVWIAESGGDDSCILTPGEDPEAVGRVLSRLGEGGAGGGARHRFEISDRAVWLHDLLRDAGFGEQPGTGYEWEYDLSRRRSTSPLPEGFAIDSLGDDREADYAGIATCIAAAFGSRHDVAATLRNLEDNPMFRPDLSIFVRGPEARIVAYCRGTANPDNGVCGIDPVCTHPEFQRMGLSKAAVLACFRRQRQLDGRFCYIGSAPEPAPSTFLYRSLGTSSRTVAGTWSLVRP